MRTKNDHVLMVSKYKMDVELEEFLDNLPINDIGKVETKDFLHKQLCPICSISDMIYQIMRKKESE